MKLMLYNWKDRKIGAEPLFNKLINAVLFQLKESIDDFFF